MNIQIITNYVCYKYKEITNKNITKEKLNLILYFIQKEHLMFFSSPAFNYNFIFNKQNIPILFSTTQLPLNFNKKNNWNITNELAYIVNNIIHRYGDFSLQELTNLFKEEYIYKNAKENNPITLTVENIINNSENIRQYDHIWDMYYDEFEDIENYKPQ